MYFLPYIQNGNKILSKKRKEKLQKMASEDFQNLSEEEKTKKVLVCRDLYRNPFKDKAI